MPTDGVTDLVFDSYKIRQGKMAILELQGKNMCCVPECAMYEYEDGIAENDILNIVVWHPTRRDFMESIRFINETVGFRVVEGTINFPDTASFFVLGKSLEEARLSIEEDLQKELPDVRVFISYRDRLSKKVELMGLVSLNHVPVDGKIRLFDVLSKAQVPTYANWFASYIVRDGKPLAIDFARLVKEGDMCQNIVMRGGDKVYIADPNDSKIMVMGEVLTPRPVNVPTGSISIKEALVSAGGIPFTGNRNAILVIRGNVACPKIYLLTWDHILHLPNDSLLLMEGDTVYVAETPITQWNRFISQILPSMSGIQSCTEIYGGGG